MGIENPQANKAENSNLFDLRDDTRRMRLRMISTNNTLSFWLTLLKTLVSQRGLQR